MIPLAKVVKPWGLSGEVSVFVFSRDFDTFLSYPHFFFAETDDTSPIKVVSARLISKKAVLCLSCSQSIEEAEKLRGLTLCLPREEIFSRAEQKSKQSFLVSDFVGLDVCIETEGGRSFSGKVTAYYDAGVNGVFEVSSRESSFLVPAELSYFKSVDLEKKSATIVNTSQLLLPDL